MVNRKRGREEEIRRNETREKEEGRDNGEWENKVNKKTQYRTGSMERGGKKEKKT